ncbi:MAG: holo-ACP synthase [Campylobacterota bacterium]|nr:holo-ACP synthase [Campylobacterota bacterium]
MIGIDLVKISRIQSMMDRFGEKALKRFLNDDEILHVKRASTAAGFWAAKEACSKALGTGIGAECSFHDISISKSFRGAPLLTLSAKLIEKFHIQDTSLSITHDDDYAIAVVAIESSPTDKV